METIVETIVSPDISITKTEVFDIAFARQLLNNKDIAKDDRDKLRRYVKGAEKGNKHITTYKLGKNCKSEFLGRLVALKGEGLQCLQKDIRNGIAHQYYHDIDMVNAQPNILAQYCEKQGWKCDAIRKYVSQREELLSELCEALNIQRWEAKERVIALFYGSNNANDLTDFFKDELLPELRRIMENNFKFNVEKLKWLGNQPNRVGKGLAYILQTEERTCLLAMDRSLTKNGRSMDVFIHDGGLVQKKEGEQTLPTELLRKVEADVKRDTGYSVQLLVKPMKSLFEKQDDEDEDLIDEDVIIDDLYAAKQFIDMMGDSIIYCEGQIYIYDSGIYSNDDELLNRKISDANLIFKQKGSNGIITFNYSGMAKKTQELKKKLTSVLPIQDDFMIKGRNKACHKLLFKNGIYDFKTNTFNKEFDKSVVFSYRIPRDYKDDVACEDIDFINKTFFEDPFNNTETPAIFKHYLMRGLIGDYRAKKFLVVLGDTNSSKGTLTNFLEYVFSGFVKMFNPNQIILKRETNASRDLSFALDIANSRLAVSSEMKMLEGLAIDGNLMKTIVSGGDTLVARRLYKEEERFVNYSMPILFANDLPPFSPVDTAIRERLVVIQYDYSFVDEPKTEFEKKGNPQIKDIIQTEKYADAFIHLILKEYYKWEENQFKPPTLPKYLLEERNTMARVTELKPIIEERYEITGNEEDCISCSEILKHLKDNEISMSDTKLGRELSKLGLGKKVVKLDKKAVMCRSGLKLRVD